MEKLQITEAEALRGIEFYFRRAGRARMFRLMSIVFGVIAGWGALSLNNGRAILVVGGWDVSTAVTLGVKVVLFSLFFIASSRIFMKAFTSWNDRRIQMVWNDWRSFFHNEMWVGISADDVVNLKDGRVMARRKEIVRCLSDGTVSALVAGSARKLIFLKGDWCQWAKGDGVKR